MAYDAVTLWLSELAQGDQHAADRIWQRYFEKLVHLARKKLDGLPRRAADEEDVALSAMHSFCRAMAAGRYPQLQDRDDLWKLLVPITSHKAVAQFRRQRAEKRGGGHVRGESIFVGSGVYAPLYAAPPFYGPLPGYVRPYSGHGHGAHHHHHYR